VVPDVTFSICVRETYAADDSEMRSASGSRTASGGGDEQTRFGVAVTTRLPAVGTLCPFASENGAIATQSLTNVGLGRKGLRYVDDGLAVDDALQALLNADEGAVHRQLHGIDADGTFAFSGEECKPWYGHVEGGNYTVAGNLLTGEAVVDAVAATYEDRAADGVDVEAEGPLAERLIDALEAWHAEGGRQARGAARPEGRAARRDHRGPRPRAVLRRPPGRRHRDADRGPPVDLRTREGGTGDGEGALRGWRERRGRERRDEQGRGRRD
jgi:uncharacterized Ntn-hydrolase superfamily protein